MLKDIQFANPSRELVELYSFKEWRQRIHLQDNLFTPGTRCEFEWEHCRLPDQLSGVSFLDVGSNDGMFSFLAEKKGATEVTAVDLYVGEENTGLNMVGGWPQKRIELIKKSKKSAVDIKSCSIYELHTMGRVFDEVFCGNVIAWLQNPVAALTSLAKVAKNILYIREDVSKVKEKPVLEFVNNPSMSSCMFNGNEMFYSEVLKNLGFQSVEFYPIDEYEIYKQRYIDFVKFDIKADTEVLGNPFTENAELKTDKDSTELGSFQINGKVFFNRIGWIKAKDISISKIAAIPKGFIKEQIYKNKFRKQAKENKMIICKR